MKLHLCLSLLLPLSSLLVQPSLSSSESSFVTVSGQKFLVDGKPFLFAGTNNYYITNRNKRMTDDLMSKAKSMGITVIRSWAFNAVGHPTKDSPPSVNPEAWRDYTYYQYWDAEKGESVVNEGENGLQRLDYAVKAAKDRGIRLILALTNNWQAYGGLDQYVLWLGLPNRDAFYTDRRAIAEFKKWMNYLANRVNTFTGVAYKDEPAIMAWELMNEPRCKGCADYGSCGNCPKCRTSSSSCTIDTMTKWVDEVSLYAQQVFPKQLIAVGNEGFLKTDKQEYAYDGSEGDNEALIKLPGIDFSTVHCYIEQWGKQPSWAAGWIRDHLKLSAKYAKPTLFEEFGLTEYGDVMAQEEKRNAFLDEFIGEVNKGKGYWAFWMLSAGETYADQGPITSLYPNYDGYTVYYQDANGRVTPSGLQMARRVNQTVQAQMTSW